MWILKKGKKDIHITYFQLRMLFESGLFFVNFRNLKNKVSKVEKVWYPIMVARNKSTSEVDNE
ncbi:hypothetical protein AU384_11505 [Bacillus halotolerans]|nr:hypothetical protein AU384_11505 [Bacillus halotolerans]OEC78633.1 hypothetical protein BCV60_09260 [Bacillus halotolerans]